MYEQLDPEQRSALLDTIARFESYCEQNPQADEIPEPTSPALTQGEVMVVLPVIASLDTYHAVHSEFVANARPSGPRHSA